MASGWLENPNLDLTSYRAYAIHIKFIQQRLAIGEHVTGEGKGFCFHLIKHGLWAAWFLSAGTFLIYTWFQLDSLKPVAFKDTGATSFYNVEIAKISVGYGLSITFVSYIFWQLLIENPIFPLSNAKKVKLSKKIDLIWYPIGVAAAIVAINSANSIYQTIFYVEAQATAAKSLANIEENRSRFLKACETQGSLKVDLHGVCDIALNSNYLLPREEFRASRLACNRLFELKENAEMKEFDLVFYDQVEQVSLDKFGIYYYCQQVIRLLENERVTDEAATADVLGNEQAIISRYIWIWIIAFAIGLKLNKTRIDLMAYK